MPFGATNTDIMGLGSYIGEVRQGPDGQLYEWVEGVDGLGNPVGFWRGLRKAVGAIRKGFKKAVQPLVRAALPFTKFIPGVGPVIHQAGTMAQRAGLLGTGQIAQGPDGQLYEYVEGVDGLGNPVGFWKALRSAAAGLIQRIPGVSNIKKHTGAFCQAIPQLQTVAQQTPALMPAFRAVNAGCGALKRVGLAGVDGLMEAPDGQLYEVVEGIGQTGVRRPMLRRVRLVIPAHIAPARRRAASGAPPPPAAR